ncbi:SOS response-associated peptidase [Ereboglobus sp. PH5-10]|uniref:SOS response-associated peptidase n=1 Tax=Ereboglobus sp. PH5-10 TaxID=2940629 RepID=UPI002405A99C|nr:SOS response-associated peptidase [Ereboglobus sp. PH5-10]
MCCRYMLLGKDARDLLAAAGIPDEEGDTAYPGDNYNIAPSSKIKVVRAKPGRVKRERECVSLHWGLRWHGAGVQRTSAPPIVNVRAESLLSKAGFREALMSRRCLIPASGFYEWEKAGRARFPWLFQLRDKRPFFLAGIWDRLPDRDANGACAIITTEPNNVMRPIHHRMPMIVPAEDATRWLDGDARDGMSTLLLLPFEDALMRARRVSSHVNNTRNAGPECVAPPAADDEPDGRQGMLF